MKFGTFDFTGNSFSFLRGSDAFDRAAAGSAKNIGFENCLSIKTSGFRVKTEFLK